MYDHQDDGAGNRASPIGREGSRPAAAGLPRTPGSTGRSPCGRTARITAGERRIADDSRVAWDGRPPVERGRLLRAEAERRAAVWRLASGVWRLAELAEEIARLEDGIAEADPAWLAAHHAARDRRA